MSVSSLLLDWRLGEVGTPGNWTSHNRDWVPDQHSRAELAM